MLAVENLCKTHPHRAEPALDGVELRARPATICGVFGPAGSGKTSLLRCLAGLDVADSGRVTVSGRPVALRRGRRRGARRPVGFVPESDALLHECTVAGNIARPFELAGFDRVARQVRVAELLELTGLRAESHASLFQLRPEQLRRLQVAQALAAGASVLVLDDVDEHVGSGGGGALATVLDRVRGELGLTVVLATDDSEVVRRLCDDVVVLDGGRVLESGPVLELLARRRSRTAELLLDPVAAPAVAGPLRAGLPGDACLVDVVLVGYAAVGSLLPLAVSRFGIAMTYLSGGVVPVAGTLVGRFRVSIAGHGTGRALDWLASQRCAVWEVEDPTMAA
ncbi:D-methionine transport system ATP-binding protein [Saccharopolyspora erythraea NRRL 2338]|uniref:ABC transporter ATP-binding protein n=2 Tax=Saccharopolyspora erythraea TaxID=1836 RepID=A4FH62_SACEN|nr:ATP-binding cassette domain-containing protein [Saccharopolyspora erythraea]EQD82700.1 methionine ABC transporter ATP-binding protein [Saccharopolyspora erythraea D]PFG97087.1 D-methionine transport system ATP-binding protein [Saccharopolyspora erythraea NRRL 2338]QRK87297.1 ATP-binding cassette domain-containing protein [Saccharopolyspora erythraea]CAM03387.1 ABC transporter ATP-binding protein [Saccharopolyspora erythraea NRRL 2338]